MDITEKAYKELHELNGKVLYDGMKQFRVTESQKNEIRIYVEFVAMTEKDAREIIDVTVGEIVQYYIIEFSDVGLDMIEAEIIIPIIFDENTPKKSPLDGIDIKAWNF